MIKSKLGFIGWYSFSIETFFFLIVTILAADTTSSYFFSFDFIGKADAGKNNGFLLLLVLTAFLIFFFRALTIIKLYKITFIDVNNKTVSFKNVFTRRTKTYSIKNLDGYYDAIKSSNFGSHKEILFIQNNKVVSIISSAYTSNYNDLSNNLSNIKYLGRLDYNFHDKLNMFLDKELI
jgi:hypothetical protein